ncbi:LuxR C-terminal-related transcriptional regulator [Amycolatopsis plumensis]|uniref:LuxR C-terminal-related transcriptional regulator n=1 Tax=Amycolatopsis plumensis TaxID=236508 RepID=A0ABV5UA73_9PSEU
MSEDRLTGQSQNRARPSSVAVLMEGDVIRSGLTSMIESADLYTVTEWGKTDYTAHTFDTAERCIPDVAILGCDGLNTDYVRLLTERIQATGSKVILLLLVQDPDLFDTVLKISANGFLLLHEVTPGSLEHSLQEVIAGEIVIPSTLAARMLRRLRDEPNAQRHGFSNSLTPREQQALRLLIDGLSNKQIAKQLRISQHGAKRLVANVLAKLNCPNRTLAVAVALRDNIVV